MCMRIFLCRCGCGAGISELGDDRGEGFVAGNVIGPRAREALLQYLALADLVHVKQLPADRLTRFAAAADLIRAQRMVALAVDAVDVRFDGARITVVTEAQQLPVLAGGRDVHARARVHSSLRSCFRIPSFSSVDVSFVISSPRAGGRGGRRGGGPGRGGGGGAAGRSAAG